MYNLSRENYEENGTLCPSITIILSFFHGKIIGKMKRTPV